MGIKHADRISEVLRQRRTEFDDSHGFFEEGREEPFFVKNFERVQGDERDAIILTVGYGKSADGRVLYRFGPLNMEGGERRLNVAVTRAKHRMTLVSSLTASDLDPDRLKAQGAKLLRQYLQYVESRGASLGDAALQKPAMNPFEIDVWERLDKAGIPLVPQYGVSGYYIDFAAKHRTQPGRMVLAIECDGAGYHSTPTARDRDRLRQEHLERLGWRFHRIWSTEWFRSREREIERAVAAYEEALKAADGHEKGGRRPSSVSGTKNRQDDTSDEPAPARARGPRPPVQRGLPIQEYAQNNLVNLVKWVESDTLLRTEDQLLCEMMAELGFQRRGPRIVAVLKLAIAVARGKATPTVLHPKPVRTAIYRPRGRRRRW
jgi:very-short-patch-repair endonuclease